MAAVRVGPSCARVVRLLALQFWKINLPSLINLWPVLKTSFLVATFPILSPKKVKP